MQAKQCHYRATENMQKKKKKRKVAKCCGSAEEKLSIPRSLWKRRDLNWTLKNKLDSPGR